MIREIIKPQQNQIILNIPDDYVNKEVEFILFPLEENNIIQNKNTSNSKKSNLTSSLFGALKNIQLKESDYKKYLEDKYL